MKTYETTHKLVCKLFLLMTDRELCEKMHSKTCFVAYPPAYVGLLLEHGIAEARMVVEEYSIILEQDNRKPFEKKVSANHRMAR